MLGSQIWDLAPGIQDPGLFCQEHQEPGSRICGPDPGSGLPGRGFAIQDLGSGCRELVLESEIWDLLGSGNSVLGVGSWDLAWDLGAGSGIWALGSRVKSLGTGIWHL